MYQSRMCKNPQNPCQMNKTKKITNKNRTKKKTAEENSKSS